MRKRIVWLCLLFFAAVFFVDISYSKSVELRHMGMVTGGLKGTYFQFGLNLQKLMRQHGIELHVANSDGSVENIFAVYKRPHTQMGIVQSDVLAFVGKVQTDPVLKRIAKKIKMVFPLYNEEVHLLGKKDIEDFEQLEGKKVAIGQEGSGTYLTAKLLFEISGIKPADMLTISASDALRRLKNGEIDALFYVAGYPVKLFSEQVVAKDDLALVPIVSKSIVEFYPKIEIPADVYTWQQEKVNSVAVKSVLISYDFRMANCQNVGRFANLLENNLDWLRDNGHQKWQSVDLEYPLKGWQQYDCVKNYQGKTPRRMRPKKSQEINPVLEAIKDII